MTTENKKLKYHYMSDTNNKLVYGFVRYNVKRLQLINIPEVIIRLFILFIQQIDEFIYSSENAYQYYNFGFVIINNFQTIMRNNVHLHSFKEIYCDKLIQLSCNFNHRIYHCWKVEISNIPFCLDNRQLILGICNKHDRFEDKTLNSYCYYGIDNNFNQIYNTKNDHTIIKHVNIDNFQGKKVTKYDTITIEVVKWYGDTHLNFYVNDILCITYFNVKNTSYRLFVSTNIVFACCSLKWYESNILTE